MSKELALSQALLNAVLRLENSDRTLTPNEANRIRRITATALGMDDQQLATKMAEYYQRNRTQIEAYAEAKEPETKIFVALNSCPD